MVALAGAGLVILAGIYVFMPLFKEPKGNLEIELLAETELDRLLSRKAVVYSNLKDLEFEYKMGRLGDDDFNRLQAGYKAEAAMILQQLDKLGVEKDIDEVIEKAVASRVKVAPSGSRADRNVSTCPSCGAEIIPGKRFCPDCGSRI